MPQAQSRGSPKGRTFRKIRKYLFHYILLAAFCLAILFVMCYTVFFKLDQIQVNGCSVYSQAQIIDEIGAQKGESLFKVNISNAEKLLVGKLPYVRSVKISRKFPTTLKVDVQEEEVLGAVYTKEGFAILSTTGKVLETKVLALREGIPRIVGLVGLTYETGSYLRKSDTKDGELLDQIKVLQEVQKQLAANQLTDITYYDVGDILNIEVMLEDKLLLKLGSVSEMDYKLQFISKVLEGKKSGEEEFEEVPEEGTLDFSSPPALHTMSISINKVKNEEAYLDYGSNQLLQTDNIAGGQQSEPLQMTPVETPEEQQPTEEEPLVSEQLPSDDGQPPDDQPPAEQPQSQQEGQQPAQNSGLQVINGVVIGGDSAEQGSTQSQTPQTNTTPPANTSGTPQQNTAPSVNGSGTPQQNTAPQVNGSGMTQPNTAPQVNGSGTTAGSAGGQNQSPQTGTPNAAGQSGVFNAPSQAPIVNGG